MAPNEQAQKNHDELFPGHLSTVAVTDPELIEIFDNFAFDEVLRTSKLDIRTRLMVQLAAIIACQAAREYRAMLGAALNIAVTAIEAKEILYQAVPYVGIARAYDFIQATNDVLTERGIPRRVQNPDRAQATHQDRASGTPLMEA
jgi:4-carboxymuconolactone decarboxylase